MAEPGQAYAKEYQLAMDRLNKISTDSLKSYRAALYIIEKVPKIEIEGGVIENIDALLKGFTLEGKIKLVTEALEKQEPKEPTPTEEKKD